MKLLLAFALLLPTLSLAAKKEDSLTKWECDLPSGAIHYHFSITGEGDLLRGLLTEKSPSENTAKILADENVIEYSLQTSDSGFAVQFSTEDANFSLIIFKMPGDKYEGSVRTAEGDHETLSLGGFNCQKS
ncbi:MAG: hypothetical protein H7301_06715 [Cryobacterium sp.]|nr:hypothetical protein [Oligoflexia bacterium]